MMRVILKIAVVSCIVLNLYMVFKSNKKIDFDYEYKVQQSINNLNNIIELNNDSIDRDTLKITRVPINK
ncbi:hypothetical protein [uncultured Algibacter sp.]|uniref:hypothetical protein n=1 Tax=uncultured Algibacter sp. TaxID=298659 RepID=UPI0032171BDD